MLLRWSVLGPTLLVQCGERVLAGVLEQSQNTNTHRLSDIANTIPQPQNTITNELSNVGDAIPMTACSPACSFDPGTLTTATIYNWTPVKFLTTATATVIHIINKQVNETITTTKYDKLSSVSKGDWWVTFQPRTNSAGTATYSSGGIVLTYPTPFISYSTAYTVDGTYPAVYDGTTTCVASSNAECAYNGNSQCPVIVPFTAKPQVSLSTGLPAKDDPGGVFYTVEKSRTSLPAEVYESLTRDEKPFQLCSVTTRIPWVLVGATGNRMALYLTVTSTSIEADDVAMGAAIQVAATALPDVQGSVSWASSVELALQTPASTTLGEHSTTAYLTQPGPGASLSSDNLQLDGGSSSVNIQQSVTVGSAVFPIRFTTAPTVISGATTFAPVVVVGSQTALPGQTIIFNGESIAFTTSGTKTQLLVPASDGLSTKTIDIVNPLSTGENGIRLGNQFVGGLKVEAGNKAAAGGRITTIPLPTGVPSSMVFTGASGQVITATRPPGARPGTLVANGLTLSVGGPAQTINGVVASLAPDGLVVGGSASKGSTGSASKSMGVLSAFRLICRAITAVASIGGL